MSWSPLILSLRPRGGDFLIRYLLGSQSGNDVFLLFYFFRLPRELRPDPDMPLKPQMASPAAVPPTSDQRKDLALRRTGEWYGVIGRSCHPRDGDSLTLTRRGIQCRWLVIFHFNSHSIVEAPDVIWVRQMRKITSALSVKLVSLYHFVGYLIQRHTFQCQRETFIKFPLPDWS